MKTRKEVLEILALPQKSNQEHSIYYTKDIIKVIEYLTPPTEEEVCLALSEYIDKSFIDNADIVECSYDKKTKSFIDSKPHCTTICKLKYGKIQFAYVLPPHLITLIGRFYEKEND